MGILDRFRSSKSARTQASDLPTTATGSTPTPAAPVAASARARFAVIDVETTGLSPHQDRILEIAVVTTDPWGQVLDEWSTRLNPQGPVGATHIHGITDADVAHSPVFADVIATLNGRLEGAAVAAHHAKFDLAFLRAEYTRAGWDMPFLPAFCTLEASEQYLPMLDRRRLADCCWAIGVPLTGAHSALSDARATAGLLATFMQPQLHHSAGPAHEELLTAALQISWPSGPSRAASSDVPWTSSLSSRAHVVIARKASAAPPQTLVELVEQFSLIDALDEGAPAGAIPYLEKLAEVLEDGEVTAQEAEDLAALADAEQLSDADIAAANEAFVRALAHAAVDDGKVTRAERAELQSISDLLGVDKKIIPALLDQAEEARNRRLSVGLKDLPTRWPHGEPLRVGDKVVFTGCDDTLRAHLEQRSEDLGVRIIGTVSAKTTMLVTDGTYDGTKAERARELGTRTLGPDTYEVLLEHLQPAPNRNPKALPGRTLRPAPNHTYGITPDASSADGPIVSIPTRPSPADVRKWARANGYEVGTRGRLHQDLIEAYQEATGQRVV